ncbi:MULTISPECIES: tyrosine-type recombinase/integrase [Rhodococcus]|uniref:Tyrosine-type recombinase/integrase n=1 Tax=Rhodococcus oxybenzonivorans TaxID=1990687 RepID=A0AAE5A7X5_9NOCA|nr:MULTISPECIES: tyrosine-type recombinase/integrase [Rhodococcus]MDV7246765.1 tyrosine-type recombinase/integrase [Rhodococcus oxybenzonivorans]MDV7267082.1 tyrosine-type recombinase/integrase [Rhodococcus oxybenzonivorans]MDV7278351.1 tyrosine-type recombinase/integrase [Rhodococcus oxybenzonivorans]MDV7337779.1 tyrosine-type recombinase/integrase [Rhodococcus oxybenzonivorans]MDV7346719.1 tyrosine-type recombinase/integrase [Rhodococcus oxybenzonivorans]
MANRYAIREQTTGRFQARWYDDGGKRRSKTFGTKTAAKKFLDGIQADRNRGDYIDPSDSKRTYREVAELWIGSRNLRPKTAQSYRTILEQRIYPTFAERPIGSITTMDLVAWVTDLSLHGKRVGHNNKGPADPSNKRAARDARYRERAGKTPIGKPLAPGTVHNAVRVMRQVLDAAVRARYLRGNPAHGLTRDDLPKAHRDTTSTPYLSAAQVERLAVAMEETSGDHALALLVRFAAQSGMRAGECCGLRWENVDLLRGRITVSESISSLSDGDWTVVPPKNGKTRVVPVPPALRDALNALATERSSHGAFTPELYVWPGPATEEAAFGTEPMMWGRDFYLPYWKLAVAKAGLPGALRFHDLRHTCAALLIAANVPAKAIQVHLGHSSFKITMDTYGHLYEDASDTVANAMDAAFTAQATAEPTNVRAIRG